MNLIEIKTNLAMSSREIAEKTGKRHDNVLVDIKRILTELHGKEDALKFQGIYKDKYKRDKKEYLLPHHELMVLLTGYSIKLRSKVLKRWEELEEKEYLRLKQIESEQKFVKAALDYANDTFVPDADDRGKISEHSGNVRVFPRKGCWVSRGKAIMTIDSDQPFLPALEAFIKNTKGSLEISITGKAQ